MIPAFLLTTQAKLLAAGLLLAGLWWYHQHEMARVYSEATQKATESLLKHQAEEVDQKVAEITASLDTERAEVEAQRTALASERAGLVGQRKAIAAELASGISRLTDRETEVRNSVAVVTDADLIPEIRKALTAIRSAEANRSAVK